MLLHKISFHLENERRQRACCGHYLQEMCPQVLLKHVSRQRMRWSSYCREKQETIQHICLCWIHVSTGDGRKQDPTVSFASHTENLLKNFNILFHFCNKNMVLIVNVCYFKPKSPRSSWVVSFWVEILGIGIFAVSLKWKVKLEPTTKVKSGENKKAA